jgi:hypothetical protein
LLDQSPKWLYLLDPPLVEPPKLVREKLRWPKTAFLGESGLFEGVTDWRVAYASRVPFLKVAMLANNSH